MCFVKPINTEKNLVMCFAMFFTQETCLSYSKAAKEIENILPDVPFEKFAVDSWFLS